MRSWKEPGNQLMNLSLKLKPVVKVGRLIILGIKFLKLTLKDETALIKIGLVWFVQGTYFLLE